MRKYLIYILIIFLSSCKMFNPSQMFKTPSDFEYDSFKESAKEYKIQPFDKLEINIYTNKGYKLINVEGASMNNKNTGVAYLVEYDGKVKLPSLGRVEISGMTLKEAEDELEKMYEAHYVEPFVMIKVANRRVIIFSSGSANGSVIELDNENYTLIEALARSGGLSDFSKAYKIKLLRGDLNDPDIYLFNISRVKDMQKANFLLETNDIIYVETKPKYASRFMSELAPYLNMLSTGILVYTLFTNK